MVATTHRARVEGLLTEAADEHEALLAVLTPELQASLPVEAQGITRAIDHLAAAAGLTEDERRALIRPHAVNPAVMHARVFGRAPLPRETVIGSFVAEAVRRADLAVAAAALEAPAGRLGETGGVRSGLREGVEAVDVLAAELDLSHPQP